MHLFPIGLIRVSLSDCERHGLTVFWGVKLRPRTSRAAPHAFDYLSLVVMVIWKEAASEATYRPLCLRLWNTFCDRATLNPF